MVTIFLFLLTFDRKPKHKKMNLTSIIMRVVSLTAFMVVFGLTSGAGTIDLQWVTSSLDCQNNTFCATVQIKADATTKIANSTIFWSYNNALLSNPVATSLNFDDVNADYQATSFTFNQANGLGNYSITLGSGTATGGGPSGPVTSSEDVTTAWKDVVEFCFTVAAGASGDSDLQFNTTVTNFNDTDNEPPSANADVDLHTIGAAAGLNDPARCVPAALKVYLEGPYSATCINTAPGAQCIDLNPSPFGQLIPTSQPYNVSPYFYAGTESLSSIPADMVDWVLVSASTDGTTAGVVETKAGVLLSNGDVVDASGGSRLNFSTLNAATNYAFIVRHRNHLDAASPSISSTSGVFTYDFTASGPATMNTFSNLKSIGGVFVMYGGDILSAPGQLNINVEDYNIWAVETPGFASYFDSDIDLNGNVNVFDYNIWSTNTPTFGNFLSITP